jgi:hypothetical protein
MDKKGTKLEKKNHHKLGIIKNLTKGQRKKLKIKKNQIEKHYI